MKTIRRSMPLAIALALLLAPPRGRAATAGATAAAGGAIDEILVRLRTPLGAGAAAAIAPEELAALEQATGQDLTPAGRTRDGAERLRLATPAAPEALRPALNAIRALPDVLYAEPALPPGLDLAAAAAVSGKGGVPPSVTQIVVRLSDPAIVAAAEQNQPLSPSVVAQLAAIAQVGLRFSRAMSGGAYVLDLDRELSIAEASAATARLEASPGIELAEPVTTAQATREPNDTFYPLQWHYWEFPGGADLPPAWDVTLGSAGIVVAVVDTGILYGHPDLAGRALAGYDFVSDVRTSGDGDGRDGDPSDPGDWAPADWCSPGSSPHDSSWHGSHVAGTIGAATNNGSGVAGVNWTSKILPVRVLADCGGTTADIADGIRWAAGLSVPGVPANPTPARVINLSLGGSGPCSMTYQSAINAALGAGSVVVVAAGNDAGDAADHQPGNCNGVITVHAHDRDGNDTTYSNVGATVEISAPGGSTSHTSSGPIGVQAYDGVFSTLNAGATTLGAYDYEFYQGTSMATPHVAGVASLVLSTNSSLTPAQVLARLQSTARDFPGGSSCNTALCGAGMLDAADAVAQGTPTTCTPSDTTLCLQGGRFKVTVDWADLAGTPGVGRVALALPNSGLFYFYGSDNAEILVKVLNGCSDPSFPNYWVFGAAATTFEYTITVIDTDTGFVKQYHNARGVASPAIDDVNAFPTCP